MYPQRGNDEEILRGWRTTRQGGGKDKFGMFGRRGADVRAENESNKTNPLPWDGNALRRAFPRPHPRKDKETNTVCAYAVAR